MGDRNAVCLALYQAAFSPTSPILFNKSDPQSPILFANFFIDGPHLVFTIPGPPLLQQGLAVCKWRLHQEVPVVSILRKTNNGHLNWVTPRLQSELKLDGFA